MIEKILIAVDGPGASGKGTLCQNLSKYFKIPYLNTGGLYRATTRKAIESEISLTDVSSLIKIANALSVSDINAPQNFTEEIGSKTSGVSRIQAVRDSLLQYQRDFSNKPEGAVLDGRDIGTVICPNAPYKFFVTASLEVRAKRRLNDEISKGINTTFDDILKKIRERDENDKILQTKANDAVVIDTTSKTIEEVFNEVISFIR